MGLFSSFIGWDQSMGAMNALLASYLLESSVPSVNQRIAREVVNVVASVQRGRPANLILEDLSKYDRVVQMNFIALACDNLSISPPLPKCEWTRVKNPYRIGEQVSQNYIKAAVDAIKKDNGITVRWPGNDTHINFLSMYEDGRMR